MTAPVTAKKSGLFIKVLPLLGLLLVLIAKFGPLWGGLSRNGTVTLAIVVIMAVFWVLEPIPIFATALIPLVFFPLLGVTSFQVAATPYANQNVYLFFGGFVLSLALEAVGLHKRIAIGILRVLGSKPSNVIAGFILAPGLLSMWVSNTAAAVIMMPIAISVIALLSEKLPVAQHRPLALAIMFSIAFGSSIGGMGTIVGTPPNAIFLGFAQDNGISVSFVQFMMFGMPIALGGLLLLWIMLTQILFRFPKTADAGDISEKLEKLPPLSYQEKTVLVVFAFTALAWIFRVPVSKLLSPLGIGLSDPGIAMLAGVMLFTLPNGKGEKIISWKHMQQLPWGILILFGGGLSLGTQIKDTDLGSWIAEVMRGPLSGVPLIAVIAIIAVVTCAISQFASNTATAAALLPIFAPLSQAINVNILYLALPLTFAVSAVFMLPSATPPNAIIMSHESVTVKDMVKYGGIINVVFLIFMIVVIYGLLKLGVGFKV